MTSPTRKATGDLFLVSLLILFLELACIRWLPAHVIFLTFFTNVVLLASFLGMSLGCLQARSRTDHLRLTPIWLVLTLAAGLALEWTHERGLYYVEVGTQKSQPEAVFYGAESQRTDLAKFLVPIEVIAGFFFLTTALIFLGPGQELGRAFNREPHRIRAYTMNIAGSLAGIILFAICSQFWLPPVVWFAAAAVGIVYFQLRLDGAAVPKWQSPAVSIPVLIAAVALTVPTSGVLPVEDEGKQQIWSPYYRLDYMASNRIIWTNRIGHQTMHPKEDPIPSYPLIHMLRQASGLPPAERVMIIGAGSGNDVGRALTWGTPETRIDAVEIDPAIQHLGVENHPDEPYQDSRVSLHLNDGRNVLRQFAGERAGEYDLAMYALVDSLVLHSGYSNLRLESYLYTETAFEDVKTILDPDTGLFVASNYFRQGWIATRIQKSLADTFGAEPIVLTIPARENVGIEEAFEGFTVFIAGSEKALSPLRERFDRDKNFWVRYDTPMVPGDAEFEFAERPPVAGDVTDGIVDADGQRWMQFTPAKFEDAGGLLPATDDWPFLYLREPTIPAITWRGVAVMALVSFGLLIALRVRSPSNGTSGGTDLLIRMFALGAGFMLIETKAVVQMALIFGSTWMVNTFVFAAILLMILLANLFALAMRPRSLVPYFILLFVALAASWAIPLDSFLGMPEWARVSLACLLVFAPVAFAGVIFAVSFSRVARPDRAFAANIAGAMVGGLAENVSLVLGFQNLLIVAAGFYLLALSGRSAPTGVTESDPVSV